MQKFFSKFPILLSAVLGFIFLIPFIVLELVNRWQLREGFPLALFVFAWVLQVTFISIVTPIVKKIQSGTSLRENPLNLLLRIGCLALIAYIWVGWMADQWPCFMGVPNCD